MMIFKETIFDEETGIYVTKDYRIFKDCVEHQLTVVKDTAKNLILNSAPEYKQRNAALGLLSEEESEQIKNNIQNIRNISNSLEQQILTVIWDGTEENRAASCDAVQNIRWP